jgi:hypothetical protein
LKNGNKRDIPYKKTEPPLLVGSKRIISFKELSSNANIEISIINERR